MDNVDHYGIEVYHMGFGEAVRKGLLSDYKVLVLTLPKGTEPEELKAVVSKVMMEDPGKGKKKLNVDDALRFLGCIFALSKRMDSESKILLEIDPGRMHKAVAFCDSIKKSRGVSKVFTEFEATYRDRLHDDIKGALLRVESRHVDGGMGFSERENEMNWLKDGGNDADECRILSNVYCLSEGLDLPSLDAVIFLSEKNSPVQIIQSVGRVMRLAKGKKFGYIIIPVLIPQGVNPVTALDDTKLFSTVLAVLRGLKSHDDTFVSEINRLRLNDEKTSEKLIVCGKPKDHAEEDVDMSDSGGRSQLGEMIHAISDMDAYRPALYAKLVDKLGSDSDIDIWADDVGKLAKRYIARIGESVGKEGEAKRRFDAFVKDLQININPSVDRDEAIRMLAQHTASMPVFESLFEGHSFAAQNPVSKSMQGVLDVVAPDIAKSEFSAIKSEWVTEDNKVNLARMFASGIDNAVSRQRLIVELYDKFFRKAFPDVVERLGIVYTPIEVVDFIIHSVAGVLDREFGRKISDEGVHILDPFTGTGTFITRLIQSDLLGDSLERKYHKELHVSEMVLLAYYISSINIQNAYHGEMGEGTPYTPFGGICLNDTFQLYEYTHDPKNDHEWSGLGDGFGEILRENSARVDEQSKTPIMVILGNPPYSVGQRAANDNAQNLEYSYLDGRIKEKYSTNSAASSQKALYDSYIRAFRWGTERLLENGGRPGIIAFVTNAGWLDGNGMDGMRKCLAEDFSSIYVFNLRGNQRTSGELSRKEGGKIFGSGSRTPVAVTVLVRNPAKIGTAEIFYSDIGDYLSRSAKLWIIETLHDIYNPDMGWRKIVPNASGDWINQRTGTFADFIQIGDKGDKANCNTFFVPCYSLGIASGKDTWCYNSSENILKFNIRNTISFYNEQREEFHQNLSGEDQNSKVRDIVDNDSTKISWTRALLADLAKDKLITFRASNVVASSYRPFFKQHLYFDRSLNEMVYQIPRLFPTPDNPNQVICVSGIGVTKEFSVIITDIIPDLELIGKSQCFPLYWYEKEGYENSNLFSSGKRTEKVINGYVRHDGITDWILGEFKQKFGKELPRFSKTQIFHYVYGILHSPRYREAFSVDLKKSLPRIPLVTEAQDFLAFSEAGKALAKLHLGYETVKPYPAKVSGADTGRFQVEKMRFGKRPDGKPDRTVIQYSDLIRVEDIPLEAYEYVVNGKSTIDWIIERYQVKTDKDSAIINDPNDWAKEHGEPRYILDLLLRVITVSLETIRIVKGLPRLDFS
ncbi:MAG: helicase [Deltaproteobacteria bacterium]|jgi:predicted helicase|nr:helicase [Deltaproteobacteria bacterium]